MPKVAPRNLKLSAITCRNGRILTFKCETTAGTTPPDEFDFTLPQDTDLFAAIFRNTDDGSAWSLNDVWQEVQAALNPFGDTAKGAPERMKLRTLI